MKLLVDEMPYYKDDCLFTEQKWSDKEETWVCYCKLTSARCDLDEEQCSCLKALKTEPSNSEIPNNCEHITEDGVTCAKYPACDDCLDNPLNKVKGSERLLKGKDEPQKKEVEWVYNKRERLWYPYSNGELLFKDEPKTQTKTQNSNLTFEKRTMLDCYNCKRFETEDECIECLYEPKDEPQTEQPYIDIETGILHWCGWKYRRIYEDEPQTDCDHRCIQMEIGCEKTDCPWK